MNNKISLYGFNNLTKTLSFNIYDVCYAKSEREQTDYIRYIDEQYNSERLTKILCDVTEIIGATLIATITSLIFGVLLDKIVWRKKNDF